ncbi:MAG: PLP-dependent aminotransferase family protein [Cephaloticoccus sp.]|nr:PLP-dependent aminotransferase family protein [Cephaloticoccus sp.]
MSPTLKTGLSFSALGQRAQPPTIARLMSAALENPTLLSLAAGFTDSSSLPLPAVSAAVNALVGQKANESLQYGMNQGRPLLRKLLAQHLAQWEPDLVDTAVDQRFFVSNGSQQALYLAMQVLCEPGDIVLVDRPSYFVFLEMLAAMGVRAVSLPVDETGRLDAPAITALLDRLAQAGDTRRIKAVYLVSYFSNPSSRSLFEGEKVALAQSLMTRNLIIPVIEDAAYRDLFFSVRPEARSVLTVPEWSEFPKLYLSTLTKPFATGLKVGYGYCTDAEWLARMLYTKGHHDFGTANFNQAVLEHIIADGGLERQLTVIRALYQRKMHALHDTLLQEGLPDLGWTWAKPTGGLYLWLKAPDRVDTGLDSAFFHHCITAGVLYVPGALCFGDETPRNYVRLSYGVLPVAELGEAARRFVQVARGFHV